MGYSVAIVLAVFTVLGVVYAIAISFGIQSLKEFVKTELLEGMFNIAIIMMIAPGLAFAGGAMSFLSNLGGLTVQNMAGGGGAATSVTSAHDVYLSICKSYIGTGVVTTLPYIVSISVTMVILNTLHNLVIELKPGSFGFSFSPFGGLDPVIALVGMEFSFFMLMIGFFVAIPMLLYIIYFLFPIFLYTGVFLRSLPWTRSVGGSLIALFISFYIVFPSLLYPFAQYNAGQFVSLSLGNSIWDAVAFSATTLLQAVPFSNVFGNSMVNQINVFADAVSILAVQILGVLIAVIISLDLVEVIGDLLGAPSIRSHSKRLLSKVI